MPEPTAAEISAWLAREGIVETGPDFPDDGDLFAAGLDSMAVMQLVVAAEDTWQTLLTPADLTREHLQSPRALASLISIRKTNPSP